jgi:hypothetical protein
MSLQISITPKQRAAGRFVSRVRRAIQKALAEEDADRGINQSDIARAIGVNRSVISREIRGHKDLSLSRVGEIAWALGRRPIITLESTAKQTKGANEPPAGMTEPIPTRTSPAPGDPSTSTDPLAMTVVT